MVGVQSGLENKGEELYSPELSFLRAEDMTAKGFSLLQSVSWTYLIDKGVGRKRNTFR
jgi:hypothetical protein